MYIEIFQSDADIIKEYAAPADALDNAKVLLAWYGYGDYCGSSLVIFERDGKLYEVNGSHCSCSGLEEQWKPEETSWAALAKRKFYAKECEGWSKAEEELHRLIDENE